MSPQRRQRYWSVIACVPKSEMTSPSVAPQCGHRGDERGRSSGEPVTAQAPAG